MLAFDGLHVEINRPGFGIAADGGIAGVGEGAGLAVAEAGDVVFVAAEVLLFGCSVNRGRCQLYSRGQNKEETVLQLEGAELLIYDLPDNLIRGHDRRKWPWTL